MPKTRSTTTNPETGLTTVYEEQGLLERIPWMTLASIALVISFSLSAVTDLLPPKFAAVVSTVTVVATALARAFYQKAQQPTVNQTINQVQAEE